MLKIKDETSDKLVSTLEKFIEKCELENKIKLDHICFKCADTESFDKIKKDLEKTERFTFTSIISSRRISCIGLKENISTKYGNINLLELNDQKIDYSQKEGFDHIEIMPISGETCESISEIATKNSYSVNKTERPHHTTYDIKIDSFTIRLTEQMLLDKIKEGEINYI